MAHHQQREIPVNGTLVNQPTPSATAQELYHSLIEAMPDQVEGEVAITAACTFLGAMIASSVAGTKNLELRQKLIDHIRKRVAEELPGHINGVLNTLEVLPDAPSLILPPSLH